jgi:hypothetical protein
MQNAKLASRFAGDMSTSGGLKSYPLPGLKTRSLRELMTCCAGIT